MFVAEGVGVTHYAAELRGLPIWHEVPDDAFSWVLDGEPVVLTLCCSVGRHFVGEPSPDLTLCSECRRVLHLGA